MARLLVLTALLTTACFSTLHASDFYGNGAAIPEDSPYKRVERTHPRLVEHYLDIGQFETQIMIELEDKGISSAEYALERQRALEAYQYRAIPNEERQYVQDVATEAFEQSDWLVLSMALFCQRRGTYLPESEYLARNIISKVRRSEELQLEAHARICAEHALGLLVRMNVADAEQIFESALTPEFWGIEPEQLAQVPSQPGGRFELPAATASGAWQEFPPRRAEALLAHACERFILSESEPGTARHSIAEVMAKHLQAAREMLTY